MTLQEKLNYVILSNLPIREELSYLTHTIETDCTTILKLEEGWNGGTAKAADMDILKNAVKFLVDTANVLFDKKMILEAPEINLCVDGTIDLSWRTVLKYRMLINFKNNSTFAYYGDDGFETAKHAIRGEKNITDSYPELVSWMKTNLSKEKKVRLIDLAETESGPKKIKTEEESEEETTEQPDEL